MFKRLFLFIMVTIAAKMFTGCSYDVQSNGTEYLYIFLEHEIPTVQIRVGETFHAEINAIIGGTGVELHMGGIGLYLYNEDLGWNLRVEWRFARNFFGNVPEDWGNATEEERNEYFADYLIGWNSLEPNNEIEEINISIFWLDGAGRESHTFYTETSGKMVQFYRHGIHHKTIVIGFYNLFLQFDDEGAFFIEFNNTADDDDKFNKNEAIFEYFLNSITLQRFYQ